GSSTPTWNLKDHRFRLTRVGGCRCRWCSQLLGTYAAVCAPSPLDGSTNPNGTDVSEKKTPRFARLVDWVGDVGDKVANATAPAREHISETAGKVQSGAKLAFEQAADHIADFKDEVTKNLPGKHKN